MRNKTILLVMLATLAVGCRGPMVAPAFRRLKPDEQAEVQQMWDNMLARPDRLDRELLLDVMIAFELHELGVDRATYHVEKDYADGVVLMDIKYDRLKPLDDWFFVEIHDKKGQVVRKEHYCGEEVWSHYDEVFKTVLTGGATTQPTTQPLPATRPTSQPTDDELAWQRRVIRFKQIMAATQPMKDKH